MQVKVGGSHQGASVAALPPCGVDQRVGSPSQLAARGEARIVAETLDPVVSVSAVARWHGLNPNQLFTWRRPFRDEMEHWPVDNGDDARAAVCTGRIELLVAGVTVRVGNDIDTAALRRVLEVVRSL